MSEKVVLSPAEKLILQMLCDLHTHLKVESQIDADLVREAITSGHLWALSNMSAFETPVSEAVARETQDILFMWQRLEESYDNLSESEKDELAAAVELYGEGVRFTGFDGNNESEYLSAARLMIYKLDRFASLKDRRDHLDSHMPTLEVHRRMLGIFEPILQEITNKDCTAAQIAEVMTRSMPHRARATTWRRLIDDLDRQDSAG